MTHISDLVDVDNLERMIEAGYVNRQVNDDGYSLFNYTNAAAYERVWNNETMRSRGLVIDPDGILQSRCLPKFFNLEEHESGVAPYGLPALPFEVYDKLDGSMILASRLPDGRALITSRGSFNSWHAQTAEYLFPAAGTIPEGETWMFELIHPGCRVVVNYGTREELVLLARMDTFSGEELPLEWDGPVAKQFDGLADFDEIMARLSQVEDGTQAEGYVIRFADGTRTKAKAESYKALHKVVTGLSNRSIWEHLSAGTINELRDVTPDEFYDWFDEHVEALTSRFQEISFHAHTDLEDIQVNLPGADRKTLAEAIKRTTYPGLCFALLDGKNIDDRVWRMVKPEREGALVNTTEAE